MDMRVYQGQGPLGYAGLFPLISYGQTILSWRASYWNINSSNTRQKFFPGSSYRKSDDSRRQRFAHALPVNFSSINGKNYLEWAQSVKLAVDSRGKIRHLTGEM
uniref:Retrotransposon Copia-like N-terminal domain-containing protein n=1 Tax=Solanum lycopersicum TaxID=4081 RepID=A0A3Q7HB54_SOLLC